MCCVCIFDVRVSISVCECVCVIWVYMCHECRCVSCLFLCLCVYVCLHLCGILWLSVFDCTDTHMYAVPGNVTCLTYKSKNPIIRHLSDFLFCFFSAQFPGWWSLDPVPPCFPCRPTSVRGRLSRAAWTVTRRNPTCAIQYPFLIGECHKGSMNMKSSKRSAT